MVLTLSTHPAWSAGGFGVEERCSGTQRPEDPSGSLPHSPFRGWMGAWKQLSPTGGYLRNALRSPQNNSKKQQLLKGTLEPVEQTLKYTPYLGHHGGVREPVPTKEMRGIPLVLQMSLCCDQEICLSSSSTFLFSWVRL